MNLRKQISLTALDEIARRLSLEHEITSPDFRDLFISTFIEYVWTEKGIRRHLADLSAMEQDFKALNGCVTQPACYGTITHLEAERMRHQNAILDLRGVLMSLGRVSPKAAGAARSWIDNNRYNWIAIPGGYGSGQETESGVGSKDGTGSGFVP